MRNGVNGEDMIVLWLDRSDVLNLMYACALSKNRSSLNGPDDWDKLYDKLKGHLFGDELKGEENGEIHKSGSLDR